jgi:hypothetical protein
LEVAESSLAQIQQLERSEIYPRLALLEALSTFKDEPKPRPLSDDLKCQARRNFLDSFAYLCDTRKGGSTVTAAAIESSGDGDILWLAANEGISDVTLDYARSLLDLSKTATPHTQDSVRDNIVRLAVHQCRHRVLFYQHEVRRYAINCRMILRWREQDDTSMAKVQSPLES